MVFMIGLATMLVANRRGVSVDDRIVVPEIAFGKDGFGDHRSPKNLCEFKGRGVLKRLQTPLRTDERIIDPNDGGGLSSTERVTGR